MVRAKLFIFLALKPGAAYACFTIQGYASYGATYEVEHAERVKTGIYVRTDAPYGQATWVENDAQEGLV